MANTTSTTSFRADISNLKAQMSAASRSVKLANAEFKNMTAGMEDWSSTAEGLQGKIKQLNTTLTSQKTVLSLMQEELKKTTEEYGENSAEADKVRIKLNYQEAAIKKTESELSKYENELEDCKNGTGKFADETEEATDSMKSADKETANLSDGFTVMKGVMADLVASGIKALISGLKDLASEAYEAYQEFDQGYDTIISKTGAAGEALKELEGNYKGVLETVVTETETAGSAVGEINTKFGLTGDALTELSTKFIKFATLNNTDVTTSIDNVQSAMTAWGVETENAGDVLDLFNTLGQKTGISMDSLSSSLTSNAATLKDMGFNLEEASTFLANLEISGVDASTVLSGLKKVLTNSAKEGKSTAEALKDLQTELENTETDADATVAVMELFGSKAGVSIAEACQSGRLNFEDLSEAITDYKGSVEETYDATLDGTDEIKLAYQTMRTELGDYVSDLVDDYAPEIKETLSELKEAFVIILDSVKERSPEIKETLKTIIKTITDGIVTIVQNFEGIKSLVTTVGTVIGSAFVVSKIMTFASSLITMYQTFQTLKIATDAATTSQLLLNAAEAATPVGLVAAGVAALAAGLIYLASQDIEVREATVSLTEAEQENIDKIWAEKEAYEKLLETRESSVSAINSEYDHYEELFEELDSMVDKSGEVNEADQVRANFIITTLNEALGTEMEMIDGVIQNYEEEKQAIESLIETKRAEAVLSANEELYTTAIQNRNTALKDLTTAEETYKNKIDEVADAKEELNKLENSSIEQYAADNYITATEAASKYAIAVENAKRKVSEANGAYVEAKTALIQAGNQYDQYNATIKNYEGLSSAIISGDTTKISTALTEMTYNFQTAETSCKESLEKQVTDYEENLADLEEAIKQGTPGVTQEMVNQAQSMVNAAKSELAKFPSQAAAEADAGAWSFYTTLGSNSNITSTFNTAGELRDAAQKGLIPNGGEKDAADNFTQGYIDSVYARSSEAYEAGSNMTSKAVQGADDGQESNSPSKATYRSGENFGQGFINGINSKTNSVWQTAWNLAKTALNALKSGQQEGSPSKLTYQSGVNFTKGYINGVVSLENDLKKAVKTLVTAAINEAKNVTDYGFSEAGSGISDNISNTLTQKINYINNRLSYANDKRIAEFDKQIEKLENEQTKKLTKLENEQSSRIYKIETERDKKVAALEKKKNKAKTDEQKKLYDQQIADEKSHADNMIKVVKSDYDQQTSLVKKHYAQLISTQEKYKAAYQDASSEFLSEFSSAINDYATKAQNLIDETINGIGDRYQEKYDALIEKQNSLINKLKSAGDLFEISGAGVMTVNDLKKQTKQITEYTQKLANIKSKVSTELFEEISSYDLKEGSAFIDRLLALSTEELKAYNDAYTEKMQAAEKAGDTIYGNEIRKVGEDYEKELNKALQDLPAQLEKLGNETMKGFIDGLTQNTDYMSEEVKTFIKSMIDIFKDELKIASPSKVMMQLGDYTGIGFVDGLKDTISSVKKTASQIASEAAIPLEDLHKSFGMASNNASYSVGGYGVSQTTVINNYELVQNNTSPKSLSALETFQARKRQIEMIKAVGG